MGKAGDLTLAIASDSLSGVDLSVVDRVLVTIAAADGTMPAAPLVDVFITPGNSTANLPHVLSDSELLGYLAEGPVLLHFSVSGSLPERPILLTHSLVAQVEIAVSAPVSKL
jgi:hypothetical protein